MGGGSIFVDDETRGSGKFWQITSLLGSIHVVDGGSRRHEEIVPLRYPSSEIPDVLDEEKPVERGRAAILVSFVFSEIALLELISGRFKPRGKLPFASGTNTTGGDRQRARRARLPRAPLTRYIHSSSG